MTWKRVPIRAASVCKRNGHAKACVSESHSRELLEWADFHVVGIIKLMPAHFLSAMYYKGLLCGD
jgi:hypothetical protein